MRFAVLVAGLIGFALTGKQVYFAVIVVAVAATAILAILFTSIGALLGMFVLAAPIIGLVSAGRRLSPVSAR